MFSAYTKIGLFSSLMLGLTLILFPLLFVLILQQGPVFIWKDLSGFIAHYQVGGHRLQTMAYALVFAMGPLFLIVLFMLNEFLPPERKGFSRPGLAFGLAYLICSSQHYFTQLSSVRFQLQAENYTWLEAFLHANPYSYSMGVNMLGICFFMGLSCLFFCLSLNRQQESQKVLYWGFSICAFFSLLAVPAYLFQWVGLLFFCVNLGNGLGLLLVSGGAVRFFLIKKKEGSSSPM